MTKTIPPNEIKVDPTSYVDPNARVFEWQDNIYRAISPEKELFFDTLLDSELFDELKKKNRIVNTVKTDLKLEGYAFVVKHDRIPFVSYCVEWPAIMLKEAALLTVDLCLKLAKANLSLQDAYPWNIFFKFTQPLFIDIGSIIEAPSNLLWTPYQQFCQFFLYPLYLASSGKSKIIRSLLFDYLNGIKEEDINKLLPNIYKISHPRLFLRVILPYWIEKLFPDAPQKIRKMLEPVTLEMIKNNKIVGMRDKFLRELMREIEGSRIPIKKSNWYKYYGDEFSYSIESDISWNQKQKIVRQVLERIKPKTVLDVACNRGWFALLAAARGSSVVAFDIDEDCVAQLYLDAKERGLMVLPLVMDILNPTPSFGWNASQFPSAIERLRCEMVFAFAIVHHLVFKQLQNFDRIASTLNSFSSKWVLVEFPCPDDEKVKSMWTDRCNWYKLDNFISALEKQFTIENIYESYPPTRKLLLCQKKAI